MEIIVIKKIINIFEKAGFFEKIIFEKISFEKIDFEKINFDKI